MRVYTAQQDEKQCGDSRKTKGVRFQVVQMGFLDMSLIVLVIEVLDMSMLELKGHESV